MNTYAADSALRYMQSKKNHKAIRILLVEDNLPDIVLTKKAFAKGKIPNTISAVRDGEEAMDFLHKRGIYGHVEKPDLILLDLNLPRKTGYEVLKEIKSDAALMAIPVIILSSSEAEQDISRSYALHANSYLVKPDNLRNFVEMVDHIEGFWFRLAKFTK
jgi:CheY-like chemotaxis protein